MIVAWLAKNVSVFTSLLFLAYLLTNSRIPVKDYGCHNFNCTLNRYGTCDEGWVFSLLYNCYPRSCNIPGMVTSNHICQLSQYPNYICSKPPCYTDFYTKIGQHIVLVPLAITDLAFQYIHASTLFVVYITYKILDRLNILVQTPVVLYIFIIIIITQL